MIAEKSAQEFFARARADEACPNKGKKPIGKSGGIYPKKSEISNHREVNL